MIAGDRPKARALKAELRTAEDAWEEALETLAPETSGSEQRGSLVPLREQVYNALTLLAVPAAPRLIAQTPPGAADGAGPTKPGAVIRAARPNPATHEHVARSPREAAAQRARAGLDETKQLFGTPPRTTPREGGPP